MRVDTEHVSEQASREGGRTGHGPRMGVGPGVMAGVLLVLALSVAFTRPQWTNLHALQAAAWLEGRLEVPAGHHDLAEHGGRAYVPFPPFPTLLLLPVVAVTGVERAPVRGLAVVLAALALWAAARLVRRLEAPLTVTTWLAVGLLMGTAFWMCVTHSEGVWYFAHVVATTALLLAVGEALGRGRGWLVGALVGAAFLSRQLAVYSLLFAVAALWGRAAPRGRRAQVLEVLGCLGVFAVCAVGYLWLNAARFGNPLDTGYSAIPLSEFLAARVQRYGLFHPAYVPFNFLYMFLQGPHVSFGGEALLRPAGTDPMGTSLTLASPFVFLALRARGPRLLLLGAWATVGLGLLHMLLYYNNGYVQTNAQRFTLDVLPVLLVLVALGARRTPEGWTKASVAWAVGLNLVMLFLVRALGRALGGL